MDIKAQLPLYKDQSKGAIDFAQHHFPILHLTPMYEEFKQQDIWSEHECVSILMGLLVADPVFEKLDSLKNKFRPTYLKNLTEEEEWMAAVYNLFLNIRQIIDNAVEFERLKTKPTSIDKETSTGCFWPDRFFYGLGFLDYMARYNSFPIPPELMFYKGADGCLRWYKGKIGAMRLGEDRSIELDDDGMWVEKSHTEKSSVDIEAVVKQTAEYINKQDELSKMDPDQELDSLLAIVVPEITLFYKSLNEVMRDNGGMLNTSKKTAIEAFDIISGECKTLILDDVQKGDFYGSNQYTRDIYAGITQNVIKRVQPSLFALCPETKNRKKLYDKIKPLKNKF